MSILDRFLAYCFHPQNETFYAVLPSCDAVWHFFIDWARLFREVMIT